MLSEDTLHDFNMTHEIQRLVIDNLKAESPHISYVEYFSDGCAAQYKNKYNFNSFMTEVAIIGIGASVMKELKPFACIKMALS